MKKQPIYIRENDGKITEIKGVGGIPEVEDSHSETGLRLAASLRPELVISRADYDKQHHDFLVKRFGDTYGPTVEALKEKRSLTAQQLGEIIKVPEKRAKTLLERFYRGNFVGKVGQTYTLTAENEDDISKTFGYEK